MLVAGMTCPELKEFYLDHLFSNLVPYWLKNGIDRENGGFFTCFNNAGDTLLSRNKYTWSQGRFLWMLGRLIYAFSDHFDAGTAGLVESAAEMGARFLARHALLPNGSCAWVLNQTGSPILTNRDGSTKTPGKGDVYDLGTNADMFLIYGMGEVSRALGRREYFDFALDLFLSVRERIASGCARTYPHDTPAGYRTHTQPMIMLETAQELADIARLFDRPSEQTLEAVALESLREIVDVFVKPDRGLVLEAVKSDGTPAYDEMLGSYVNPGHALEDAWFIMHSAMRNGDRELLQTAVNIVRWMVARGWDGDHGGLLYFVHVDGGRPRGRVDRANAGDHMIVELSENWSDKLWWVHSEALYALILSYEHSRDVQLLESYWKLHRYVFDTFPNPDREVGEWIQIRNRAGEPEAKVVALPVKDPYHITRACMHIITALERIGRF